MKRKRTTPWHVAFAAMLVLVGRFALADDAPVVDSSSGRSTPQSDVLNSSWEGPKVMPAEQPPLVPIAAFMQRPMEGSWYGRVEYFDWNQVFNGVDQDCESGTLYTIGYMKRILANRFRAEFFTGTMHSNILVELDDGAKTPVPTNTRHLGGRVEYEYLWDMAQYGGPPLTIFVGIGTRFWTKDSQVGQDNFGDWWCFPEQTWWTIYPYVGSEKSWDLGDGKEFFALSRIGGTVVTYQKAASPQAPAYYPWPNITAQVQCGWRSERLTFAFYFEAMTWQRSEDEHIHGDTSSDRYIWPATQMFTTGLQFGLRF